MPPLSLATAIDGLPSEPYAGFAYRHVSEARTPLSAAGARTQGGRWNPPDSFATLYLTQESETAVAEFFRMAKRIGRTASDFLPRRVYRYEVELVDALDLRPADGRAALGLADAQLRGDDLGPCQAIGETAHYLGREGILAPSAAGAGNVLAVFSDRLQAGSFVRDVDFELWTAPPMT